MYVYNCVTNLVFIFFCFYADSCGNERSLQGVLIKVATSLSLLLMICSTVLLGGYLIICRSQPTKLYSIEVPTSSSIKVNYDVCVMQCMEYVF